MIGPPSAAPLPQRVSQRPRGRPPPRNNSIRWRPAIRDNADKTPQSTAQAPPKPQQQLSPPRQPPLGGAPRVPKAAPPPPHPHIHTWHCSRNQWAHQQFNRRTMVWAIAAARRVAGAPRVRRARLRGGGTGADQATGAWPKTFNARSLFDACALLVERPTTGRNPRSPNEARRRLQTGQVGRPTSGPSARRQQRPESRPQKRPTNSTSHTELWQTNADLYKLANLAGRLKTVSFAYVSQDGQTEHARRWCSPIRSGLGWSWCRRRMLERQGSTTMRERCCARRGKICGPSSEPLRQTWHGGAGSPSHGP